MATRFFDANARVGALSEEGQERGKWKGRIVNSFRNLAGQGPEFDRDEDDDGVDQSRAGQILVPLAQIDIYNEARKEERKWVRKALATRTRMRAAVIMYLAILLGFLLYNGFSNRSSLRRMGQVGDANKAESMYANSTEYQEARAAHDATIASVNQRVAEYQAKVSKYKAEGRANYVTYWLGKIEQANAQRMESQRAFDAKTGAARKTARQAVDVAGDYVFHELLAFALPMMVLFCSIGAERLRHPLAFALMFLLQLPNSFFVMNSTCHIFPTPPLLLPAIGASSVPAVIIALAVFFGEPYAYYVISRRIRELNESWHDALQMVLEHRAVVMALRGEIRTAVIDEKMECIDGASQINAAWMKTKSVVREMRTNEKIQEVEAVAAVEERKVNAEVGILMPRADTSTKLAKIVIDMQSTGAWAALEAKGVNLEQVCVANNLKVGTVRSEITRCRKQNAAKADETQEVGPVIGEEVDE